MATFIDEKTSLATEYAEDFTQVDIDALVEDDPTEAVLEVRTKSGCEVQFRADEDGIVLSHKASSGAAGIENIAQIVVPLATNRYFEYKTIGNAEGLDISLVAHNGVAVPD